MYICWIQSTCVKKGARNSTLKDALPQCGPTWHHRGRLLKYFSISNSLLKTLSDQLESELLISQEQNKPAIIVICYDIVRYDRTLICYDIVRTSLLFATIELLFATIRRLFACELLFATPSLWPSLCSVRFRRLQFRRLQFRRQSLMDCSEERGDRRGHSTPPEALLCFS